MSELSISCLINSYSLQLPYAPVNGATPASSIAKLALVGPSGYCMIFVNLAMLFNKLSTFSSLKRKSNGSDKN